MKSALTFRLKTAGIVVPGQGVDIDSAWAINNIAGNIIYLIRQRGWTHRNRPGGMGFHFSGFGDFNAKINR
jgi:hypothetical protein